MSADRDEVFDRARTIVAASRIAQWVCGVCRVLLASVLASWSYAAIHRRLHAFRSLSAKEQIACAMLTTVTAVSGHWMLARALPVQSQPTPALTALVLLAICLSAAGIALRRGR